MNVLQINTYDSVGGAGRALNRLHTGLIELGIDSRILVRTKRSDEGAISPILPERGVTKILDRIAIQVTEWTAWQYHYFPSTHRLRHHAWVRRAHIINLHNTHGNYFAHTALPGLSRVAPIVWTLHDMWSFTGHCSYSHDCERWQRGCGACPYLETYPGLRRDTTSTLWKRKKRIYDQTHLTIVTPSQWLASLANQSPLFEGKKIYSIPNSVDTNLYRPINKAAARETLQIPKDRIIVMFAAEKINDPRKGLDLLREALEKTPHFSHQRIELLVVGQGKALWRNSVSLPVHSIGEVSNEKTMAACYAAADIFVLPSRQDNLPNGLLESIACGTPCVAFNIGGIPEVLGHLETGYLAQPASAEDLARGLSTLINDEQLRQTMSAHGRRIAEQRFALEVQAGRYLRLYKSLIDNGSST